MLSASSFIASWTRLRSTRKLESTSTFCKNPPPFLFHSIPTSSIIMSTPDYFPVETRVILKGLLKSPDLNGKVGIVKSGLFNGRQHVLVEELSKSVALKVSNLSFEGRTVDSLSVKELKAILKFKENTSDTELTGIDKSELQSKVANLKDTSPEKIAQWLAEAKTTTTTTTTSSASTGSTTTRPSSSNPTVNPAQAADQLATMNPEQLRQQARMMRSMPPDTIRRMNPQLAHMSDAQIQAAANQMEMMASNPAMMKMATEQIKKMSPEEIQRAQEQAMAAGGRPPTSSHQSASSSSGSSSATRAGTPASAAPSTADQAAKAAEMMASMTPEQLRQQADMFESMSPDAIRQMNPQMAHMTNNQIKMAATQFRMMADNPDMMKMAMDQMKNMTPEQMEAIKNGSAGTDPTNPMAGGDPAKMLANMDKTQLKNMLKTMKENPDMMKQFAASSGMGEEQLAKGVEMFAELDDSKLDMAIGMMQRAQKAKDVWTKVDSKTGGHLMKIIIVVSVLVFGFLVQWLFFKSSGGGGAAPVMPMATDDIPNIAVVKEAAVEDEFESEF